MNKLDELLGMLKITRYDLEDYMEEYEEIYNIIEIWDLIKDKINYDLLKDNYESYLKALTITNQYEKKEDELYCPKCGKLLVQVCDSVLTKAYSICECGQICNYKEGKK